MKSLFVLAASLGIVATAPAQMAPPATFELDASSKLWIEGSSTVRDFKCAAGVINSTAVTTRAKVTIPVAQLECGNGKMNEHMRNALKAKENPTVEFNMTSYKLDGTSAVLVGTLTIAGMVKDIEIPATVQRDGDNLRVRASKLLEMTEWGVKPPSLMLGAMKVKDAVTVAFDVTLKP